MTVAPPNLFDLSKKVAIVTGAAGQLGKEYVKALLNAGAAIAAIDIRPCPEMTLSKEESSKRYLSLEVDITNREDVEKGLQKIRSSLGNPNVLVNNAAIDFPPDVPASECAGPFETFPESVWEKTLKVNLGGILVCCQVIGGHMAETGGGSIINISSIYGLLSPDQRIYEYKSKESPFFKPVSYSVTKAGVIQFSRYLATYWAKKGVRVNTLTLGGVLNNQDATFLRNYSERVPMGRMARPDEYSGAVVFLASDASSYMTGSNLVMDGGWTAW